MDASASHVVLINLFEVPPGADEGFIAAPSRRSGGRGQRELRFGELAVEDVQVGAADATGVNLQPQLALTGLTVRKIRSRSGAAMPLNTIARTETPGLRLPIRPSPRAGDKTTSLSLNHPC